MIDVVTDLLGEIVEIQERDLHDPEGGFRIGARGHVRAVYRTEKELCVLVEHDLGFESITYNDRARDGGFEVHSFQQKRIRVVQCCARCYHWEQKALLIRRTTKHTEKWEHRPGEGCKKATP